MLLQLELPVSPKAIMRPSGLLALFILCLMQTNGCIRDLVGIIKNSAVTPICPTVVPAILHVRMQVEVTKRSKVRRNYLTYMRERTGKSARLTGVDFDKMAVNSVVDKAAEEEEAKLAEENAAVAEAEAAKKAAEEAATEAKVAAALAQHEEAAKE